MSKLIKKKLLFIDHESGHGGSSISLYNKIKLISKKNYEIYVILKKKSHLSIQYKKLGINIQYLQIPTITALKNPLSNILYLIKFFFKFYMFYFQNLVLFQKLNFFDLVHLNHENLFWLLKFIKKKCKTKVSISVRTILPKNLFSKFQSNIINSHADKKLFISKENLIKFNELVDFRKKNNFIILNFTDLKARKNQFLIKKNKYKNFNIISLSNFSYDRGLDRILEIAIELKKKKIKNINFIFLGDYKFFSLKNFSFNKKNNLKKIAIKNKLSNIKFLGHKKNVSKYLDKSHLLIYLPRTDSAWGRNIIESLRCGVPVITCGKTNILIKNKVNGFFLKNFDRDKVIKLLMKLYSNRNLLTKMSLSAKNISLRKFNKKKIEKKLSDFIENK